MKRENLSLRAILVGIVTALIVSVPAPTLAQDAEASTSDMPQSRPLRFLMVGLAQDMSRISDGIWHEDYEMIQNGARGVADHPRVTPEEMAAIKAALGERFEAFVAFDRQVHGSAVEIADAAGQLNLGRILESHGKLQQGCVSCHATFRDEVREALY